MSEREGNRVDGVCVCKSLKCMTAFFAEEKKKALFSVVPRRFIVKDTTLMGFQLVYCLVVGVWADIYYAIPSLFLLFSCGLLIGPLRLARRQVGQEEVL